MPDTETGQMAKRRALLTDSEREILAKERDVKDNYRYSVESRVRTRIRDELPGDVTAIRDNYPDLLNQLQEIVCEQPSEGDQPDREHPDLRAHETYSEDHWTVVDVDGVDKVFATPTGEPVDGADTVRMDIDAVAAASTMRDVGTEGDNINTSVFLTLEKASELRDQLDEAIESATDGGP